MSGILPRSFTISCYSAVFLLSRVVQAPRAGEALGCISKMSNALQSEEKMILKRTLSIKVQVSFKVLCETVGLTLVVEWS